MTLTRTKSFYIRCTVVCDLHDFPEPSNEELIEFMADRLMAAWNIDQAVLTEIPAPESEDTRITGEL